jgi:adenylate cyclase
VALVIAPEPTSGPLETARPFADRFPETQRRWSGSDPDRITGESSRLKRRDRIVCRLRIDHESRERLFTVGDRPIVIGRAPDCDLHIPHESISRQHARIAREDDGWVIRDLGSKNGSRVNTFHVSEQVLRNGDRLDLGSIRIFVEIGAESQASRARVIFEEKKSPTRQTEVLDLQDLDHLLQGGEVAPHLSFLGDKRPLNQGADDTSRGAENASELMRLVGEAAESLLSCTTLPETLDRILALVFDNIPVERGVICLLDPESGSIEPMAMRNREGVPDVPMTISTQITGAAISDRKAILIRDTAMDERFGGAESVILLEIHSAMCAPLLRDGKVSGYLYVDRQSANRAFEMPQLGALSILALLSAIAVEQAALRDDVRREQERRQRLARYSSPAVVERILEAPVVGSAGMVADEGEVSVLFADLTGFTDLAERLPPSEVILILNEIFERLTSAVFALEGTLDKFSGDGMMAFFGAPLAMPDHAARAVEAALRMQEALAALNAARADAEPLSMRIGVNSGNVVVGDIGTPQRKDYTVIGDVVNIASRLESSVAQPGQVVIGEATFAGARHAFVCDALEPVRLKGKSKTERPYLVLGRVEDPDGATRAL